MLRVRGRGRRVAALALLLLLGYGGWQIAYMLGFTHAPGRIPDLPLSEVAARAGGDAMVVLLTSDAGWAELDEDMTARFAAAGTPTVVWNSLRYYWRRRTPAEAARDLARIIRVYSAAWNRPRVILIGYSFGADVLPFLVNRLPPQEHRKIAGVALLAFANDADFKFHFAGWFGRPAGDPRPTTPAVRRLTGVPVLCISGRSDPNDACPRLRPLGVEMSSLAAGHRLGPVSNQVNDLLLAAVRCWSAPDSIPAG